MSGGVDSSVTAALLKEQGFDVTGVFIKAWHPEGFPCNWKEDRRDAMRVAAALDIPFKTLDLEKEYKQEVVDYMILEYKKGRTPNPDVMCNKSVKFGGFLKFALKEGADFIATGHYARLKEIKSLQLKTRSYELLEAKDKAKDQSYFLWTLTQDQLNHVLFPIGAYQKSDVRKLAEKFNLPTAVKKDSQGLCFIGKVDLKDFLRDHISPVQGEVLSESGEVIGTHDGVNLYTIGERHGFTITKKTTHEKPLYVVAKDISRNTLVVSDKPASNTSLLISKIELSSINWIDKPKEGKIYNARFRYHQIPEDCTVSFTKGLISLGFKKPQVGIAEGQSLVLYEGEKCLGGGVIEFAK
jgi:tRNA-specific 2-thiouridylase